MTPRPIDAHVRLDIHPAHTSAVTATLTGTRHRTAHALLTARGFETVDEHTLALARIDHEEPYWANKAAQALTAEGITTDITSSLREAIDEDWTWANYPMPWCTREEIREVSNEAQTIYDDIRHGRLVIHAHADDGWTTVAVGTYRDGKSVYLHGENHLRQIADTFDSPAAAIAAFERLHGDTMRPGPAPMTDTERQTAEARTSLDAPAAQPVQRTETVPAYAADPGDHDAALDDFLTKHGDWQKWRTWTDETTHAIHESQTLRIERVHEADPRETAWTIAAYETPVSDRMWHLTMTGATPAPVLLTLLNILAEGDAWETAVGSPATEKTVTEATRPLIDAGWKHTVDRRWIRWETSQGDAGVQFDAFAAQSPHTTLATWTLWAGASIDRPTWAIHASPYTPAPMIAHLTGELAHGTGTRQPGPRTTQQLPQLTTTPPAVAPTISSPQPARRR
ncbi:MULTISPECIES: DUF317 domain-containing protein [Streptomyces]|uniref:DUF317 domain-containing protein n=1 Tax=Streptomyces dengpaensis TaxID=2049881 RepID=A0ABM6SMR6_9ACTN|nr:MULTISPECIES: DUF317 domain-containing protein [Streptomyces]AVH55704.1 DUF317 domain-containing protein [Streptomyces dengpaensis]PIB11965.1 hypothetical protein B1C81_01825 [Streptomyces sp. HG99]